MQEYIKSIKKYPSYYFKRVNQKIKNNLIDYYLISTNRFNPEIVNQKQFRICGLRRTGNHAVINWIVKQAEGSVVHINDIFIDENPFRMMVDALESKDPDFYWRANRVKGNPLYSSKNSLDILNKEAQRKFIPKDLLVYSLEDYRPKAFNKAIIEKKHKLYFGESQEKIDILIIRDPYNLTASRLQNKTIGLKTKSFYKSFSEVWIEYAQEYLNETNHLKNKKVLVNFNKWSYDYDYRKELASKLGLKFTDHGFNEVTDYGGGSSFDGHGEKKKIDITGRWKMYKDNHLFRKVVSDKRLRKYAHEIFPELSSIERELKLT